MYRKVSFHPKREIEKIDDPGKKDQRILISITTPTDKGCKPAVLTDSWHDVLRLEFHDADVTGSLAPNFWSHNVTEKEYVLFDEDQAIKLFHFLKKNEMFDREVWVHCEAGISRSAAIAKFIAQIYLLSYPESYSLYNRHVFTTCLKTYGQCTYGDGKIQHDKLPGAWRKSNGN